MMIEEITGRIARDLGHLKQFMATPGNGCTRPSFTKEVRKAVEYLKELMTESRFDVREGTAGSVIGVLRDEDSESPCAVTGSYYDSVYNSGDYNETIGVIRAIEAARLLLGRGIRPKRDFAVVGLRGEEGTRFGTGYFGSGVILGHRDIDYMKEFRDKDGISIYEIMKEYGMDPERTREVVWEGGKIGCFLEAHIEQGPVLDTEDIEPGLVDCIVGIQHYMVTVHGRTDHAGTTPMDMGMDPMDAAAKVISRIADWARKETDGTVATVGYMNTIPGGMNIMAGTAEFAVDIRSRNNDNINDITNRTGKTLERAVGKYGDSFDTENELIITPVEPSGGVLDIMEKECGKRGYSCERMLGGAGHDVLEVGQVLPTVMLFVPSRDGRGHCPVEFAEYSDLAKAAVVMEKLAEEKVMKQHISDKRTQTRYFVMHLCLSVL